MEFPRLMYRTNAATHVGVNNEAERQVALKEGWFDSVPEAIAGKATTPAKVAPVRVFKKAGVIVDEYTAKDQAEADALIAGDGWHATKAAAIAAAWPAPDAIPGIVEGLSKDAPELVVDYAKGLGMTVNKGEKVAALLARIETTLLAGPAK